MKIGRIGSFQTNPYLSSVNRAQSSSPEAAKAAEQQKQRLPGWEGRDTFERSKTRVNNADGRVTETGGFSDYLMQTAANAARFDDFEL